jgi:hypothetical protein
MTVAPAVDRPPGAARRVLRLMIPLMLVLFISNLDATVVATAIPSIGRGLHDLAGAHKVYPVIGAVLTGASMGGLSLAGADSGALAIVVPLVFAGAGIGLFVQVALLAGQNAVEHRHLGTATGALNFFKSIGGACGAALFGALLTHGLTAGHAVSAYQAVFTWTIPFMALALILAVLMPEKPLSDEMIDVAAGKAEVPEY